MSELLRQLTVERINRRIREHVDTLTDGHTLDLTDLRLAQGKIAGLVEAVEIQNEAFKGMRD